MILLKLSIETPTQVEFKSRFWLAKKGRREKVCQFGFSLVMPIEVLQSHLVTNDRLAEILFLAFLCQLWLNFNVSIDIFEIFLTFF